MSGFRLTPAAQRDLSSIWDYTQERWGVRQAEKYVIEIRAAIERLAADPDRGRPCDEIRAGYRRLGVGHHVIFFTESSDGADIIRVLHQRMEPLRHL